MSYRTLLLAVLGLSLSGCVVYDYDPYPRHGYYHDRGYSAPREHRRYYHDDDGDRRRHHRHHDRDDDDD